MTVRYTTRDIAVALKRFETRVRVFEDDRREEHFYFHLSF